MKERSEIEKAFMSFIGRTFKDRTITGVYDNGQGKPIFYYRDQTGETKVLSCIRFIERYCL